MLDVAVALPGAGEGRGPAEEMGVAVVEESEEETAKIRMEFDGRWHGISHERQKAVVERRWMTEDEACLVVASVQVCALSGSATVSRFGLGSGGHIIIPSSKSSCHSPQRIIPPAVRIRGFILCRH
jgi:hypothetical protein